MAETQQNALKKLNRLRRVQKSESKDLRGRVTIAQANVAKAIRKAGKDPKAATSARFRNAFYGQIGTHYELLADELDKWAKDLTENLSEEWHGRIKHEAKALSASVSSPPLVAKALQFNRQRAKRYFEILNPDNATQLAATFTRQMAPSTIAGLRQSLIDTGRQAAIEGLSHREQHKLLQSKWDAISGDLLDQRFIDARGRKWDNSTYLNMLVRTTSSRITRETTLDTITDNGDDLARVHAIGDNCPICRRWDGVIFSVTGKTKNLPSYADVLAAGMFHPNCDCLTERVIPEIEAKEVEAQQDVDTPDDWTDTKAVDAYSDELPKPPNAYHPAHYEEKREHIKRLQAELRNTSGKGSRDTRKALKHEIEKQGDELDEMATILQEGGAVPPKLLAPTAKNKKIAQLTAAQARKAEPGEPKAIDTPTPAAFVPAKTVKEAEERIEKRGVKADLFGLKTDQANGVLAAIEETPDLSGLKSIESYRNAKDPGLAYSRPGGRISINVTHANKMQTGAMPLVTYKSQLDGIEKSQTTWRQFRDEMKLREKEHPSVAKETRKHLKQSRGVLNRLSMLKTNINQDIKNGYPERVQVTVQTGSSPFDKTKIAIHHEIGHQRHRTIDESTFSPNARPGWFDKKASVSEYGRTNAMEYYAEWYATYKTTGAEGVPANMMKMFRDKE